ncbi:MAG: gliding motility protein GldN, partial [Bacteroidales bacterium]|nr:gliding motility protein GldN [Bacteroidales bacterium]
MKKIVVIVLVLMSMFAIDLNAQILDEPETPPRDSFYEKISYKQRKPFTFPYVREADVVWQWRVWRVIDFREKQNQVFYYPIDPDQGRVNLFYALEQAINDGKIKIYLDDEFTTEILDWQERKMSLIPAQTTTIDVEDIDGTLYQKDTLILIPLKTEDIKTLRLKEDWFIDKSRTVQDVRISGFSPIFYRTPEDGSTPIPYPLFWVR